MQKQNYGRVIWMKKIESFMALNQEIIMVLKMKKSLYFTNI